jgi:hypothetical protein
MYRSMGSYESLYKGNFVSWALLTSHIPRPFSKGNEGSHSLVPDHMAWVRGWSRHNHVYLNLKVHSLFVHRICCDHQWQTVSQPAFSLWWKNKQTALHSSDLISCIHIHLWCQKYMYSGYCQVYLFAASTTCNWNSYVSHRFTSSQMCCTNHQKRKCKVLSVLHQALNVFIEAWRNAMNF